MAPSLDSTWSSDGGVPTCPRWGSVQNSHGRVVQATSPPPLHKSGLGTWLRDFPGGLVVETLPSNAEGVGSIPGYVAKISSASQPKNLKRIKR